MENIAYQNTLGLEHFKKEYSDLATAFYVDSTISAHGYRRDVYNSNIRNLITKHIIINKTELKDKVKFLRRVCKSYEESGDTLSCSLLSSYLDCLEQESELEGRYVNTLINITYDQKSELEKSGLAQHQRPFLCVIDLANQLDFILSEIFKIDRKQVRENLEALAAERGLTYIEVSRAILNQEQSLLCKRGIDLTLFTQCHTALADFIVNSYKANNTTIIDSFGNFIDLSEYNLDTISRTDTFFFTVVLRYMEHVLIRIIEDVYGSLRERVSSEVLLTSKGSCSIVIQSNIELNNWIVIEGDTNALAVPLVTTKPNDYFKTLSEDKVRYL